MIEYSDCYVNSHLIVRSPIKCVDEYVRLLSFVHLDQADRWFEMLSYRLSLVCVRLSILYGESLLHQRRRFTDPDIYRRVLRAG